MPPQADTRWTEPKKLLARFVVGGKKKVGRTERFQFAPRSRSTVRSLHAMRSLRGCSQLCARRARWGARRAPRGGVRRVRIGCRQHTCRNRRARRARGVGTRASTPSWVAYRAVRAQPEAQRARDGVGGLPALRDGSESTSVRVDARGLRRCIRRRQPACASAFVAFRPPPKKGRRISLS